MLIKSLQGKVYEVDLDKVYIKSLNNVYMVYGKEKDKEVVLAEYSKECIARYMISVLNTFKKCPAAPLIGAMFTEKRIEESAYIAFMSQFENIENSKERRLENERLHRG